MFREKTYAGVLGEWQKLTVPLTANAAELPHLEASRTKLQGLLAEALELTKQQKAFAAGKQEASQRLKVVVTEGQRLATILRLAVKEHFGIRAEKLAEFGLQPFRGRKERKKAPSAPGTPQPTPSTPSAPTPVTPAPTTTEP
jgi:hypothetical protein